MRPTRPIVLATALACALAGCASPEPVIEVGQAGSPVPEAPGCTLLPADSYWYAPADTLPVHPRSAEYVASIGLEEEVHADFGSGLFEGAPIGIPYVVVPGTQPGVEVSFEFADESDQVPYPIPADPPIEGGPDGDGDRHILMVDRDACVLYELFNAFPDGDGTWSAGSGAVFDLTSHAFRPDTWTSADAAGLPILPGLVRFDEIAAGEIDHAIRITVPESDNAYVWPARHEAGGADDPSLPRMGLRLRLRADADLSGLGPQAMVVARALQTYGAIVADNGSPWFISGAPDDGFDNDDLATLGTLLGSDWEAVDSSSLIVDPDSGQAAFDQPDPDPTPGPGRASGRVSGPDRIATAVAISQRAFPGGAAVAYLANAGTFVDAVAGGALTDGPVLLVPQCGVLPAVVAAEIARLDPPQVLSLGGDAAVCDAMLAAAAAS